MITLKMITPDRLPCTLFALLILFSMGGVQTPVMAQNDPDEEAWVPLFNGEDLQGWDAKITGYDLNDNVGNTFRVDDGVLKVLYERRSVGACRSGGAWRLADTPHCGRRGGS